MKASSTHLVSFSVLLIIASISFAQANKPLYIKTITGHKHSELLSPSQVATILKAPMPKQSDTCAKASAIGGSGVAPSKNTSQTCKYQGPDMTCCSDQTFEKMQSWWSGKQGSEKDQESRFDRYNRRILSLVWQTRTLIRKNLMMLT